MIIIKTDDSRLRRVHGSRGVTDVLCALKHPEGQTAEEVSGRQQAGDWTQLETSSLWNEQKHTVMELKGSSCKIYSSMVLKGNILTPLH